MFDLLKRNRKWLNLVAEPFNRPYIFLGDRSTGFCWGKTIHNTLITNVISYHAGDSDTDLIKIPIEYGHVSHFRAQYNIHWGNFPITELKFDFNYFNCFLKPIMNNLGLNFQEQNLANNGFL